ncbi:MAG: hypothetical protein IJC35_07635 [Oscillospiraceae bacterium]|nr:hypothetical protein [Oscillospiraceae bacterium]
MDAYKDIPLVQAGSPRPAPEWAKLEWKLMDRMEDAVELFLEKYTRPDGTLIWREFWPGMDGSDDAFEAFQNYPLFYALGARPRILRTAHAQWDTMAWQWTEYGQVEREFFKYYDFMHHGEGSLFLYYFGLADPMSLKFAARARRFAGFYTGEDPLAPNYDPEKKLIRAPINGSAGPRLHHTKEDWVTHRPILHDYLPPFEDMPGIPFYYKPEDYETTRKDHTRLHHACPWMDDEAYETIVEFLNKRMAQGDVPLNLNATSLMTHAYMYTGDEKYRTWVTDYLSAWEERTRQNGGIIPDNIDLEGKIGGNMDGKWWGGYYGWRWPHGALTVVEPCLNAGNNAYLMTGDEKWLDLARSQMDMLYSLGKDDGKGGVLIPHRHYDNGWGDWRYENSKWPVYCWSVTHNPDDMKRIDRLCNKDTWDKVPTKLGKGNRMEIHPWFHYLTGNNPDFPVQTLEANLACVNERIDMINADNTDHIPEEDIHYWQDHNPVVCEALVQLMLGGPTNIYHGGLMYTALRYFHEGRAGLPHGVGALVSNIQKDSVTVTLHNLNTEDKEIVIQGGCFGEHTFTSVSVDGAAPVPAEGKYVRVRIPAESGAELVLGMKRFSAKPSYRMPGQAEDVRAPKILPRELEDE